MSRNPHGMTSDELLKALGPSWSAMTPAQRDAYGPPLEDLGVERELWRVSVVVDLIDIAVRFPDAVCAEGLAPVARRWGVADRALRLAEKLDLARDNEHDPAAATPATRAPLNPAPVPSRQAAAALFRSVKVYRPRPLAAHA